MKIDSKDEWNVGEGLYDGHRIIVRQNVGARSLIGNKRLPFRVGIAVPFHSPRSDGLPGDDEVTLFRTIEDAIYDYFDAERKGILCIVITSQGMREFIIYSAVDDVSGLIGSLSQRFSKYDFQHYIERDAKWDEFKQWDR